MFKKLEIKLSSKRQEAFKGLLESLIVNGYDLWLSDRQNTINVFFDESYLYDNLILRSNGTWDLG